MTSTSDSEAQTDEGLFTACLLGLAVIAVGGVWLEILTDRWLARQANIGLLFLSIPAGVGATFLAAVSYQSDFKFKNLASILTVTFWISLLIGYSFF